MAGVLLRKGPHEDRDPSRDLCELSIPKECQQAMGDGDIHYRFQRGAKIYSTLDIRQSTFLVWSMY